jgi:hypothetical protein
MQYFIDKSTGMPWAFEDDVTVVNTDGVYSFTHTTGAREPDIVTPAVYGPDTEDEEGNTIRGELVTPESVTPGALIVYPLTSVPTTLYPCSEAEAAAASNPAPTAAEVLANNTGKQNDLLAAASVALAPLQTAVTLGIATDGETADAKAWVQYVRDLKAVDLTGASPNWPEAPIA